MSKKPYWNIRLLLWIYKKITKQAFYTLDPAEVRRRTENGPKIIDWILDPSNIPLPEVTNKQIEGRHGDIPIRIYRPNGEKNIPVILYFHGGGFVIRSIDSHDKVCRRLARDNQALVVSVGYRLAPEYKFPIGLEDCYDTFLWVVQNAVALNVDADRLVVMGDSAGGNLATAVAMMSRDLNGPDILYQVLIYPTTDGKMTQDSVEKYKSGYLLTRRLMKWFVNHYKRTDEDLDHPYLSMLFADDLSNLPPALILTAEFDPLIDEGKAYAQRLRDVGVEVEYVEYPGVIHAFFNMPGITRTALKAFDQIKTELERVLKRKNLVS